MTKNRKISGKIGLVASQYGRESRYWLNKFSGELRRSSFPYDHSKEKPEQEDPGTLKFQWTGQHFETLTALSKGMDHRLYIILTAALVVLLHKYTGSSDIIVGSPISRQEVEGDFINTVLALRTRLDDGMSFRELLLNRVRPTIIEANEHQNYPIETLLFQLNMPFTRHQFPLFDAAVLLENIHEKKHIRHTHPNIVFSFVRTPDSIEGTVEYNRSLYERDTAARLLRHFNRLIEQVIVNIDLAISRLDILGEAEKEQLLVEFNDTRTAYPAERTVDELFEEQAARVPNETAVTYEGEPLTYKELNDEADRLAAHLCFIGVAREEPVAVMAENSHKVVVALLGILKAGGAYLPVNVQYPEERKKYILNDCNARVLLTNCPEARGHDHVSTVIHLENSHIYQSTGDLHRDRGSDDLAYIMYTSGSTGTPKGVMVTHRNVVRLVKNTNYVRFEEGDSILLTGALEFDASTFEIWGALLNGLTLHLVNKDTILNAGMLKEALQKNEVSTIWMTAPLFNQMLDTDIEIFGCLKNLLVGGDVLSPTHINRVRNRFPRLTVINGYGPTENTTFSITYRVDKDYKKSIPIGKPISNSTAYILDNYSQPVPIGVTGELYVGGDGVSRGYLNNPELTAERFIDFHRSYRSYRSYNSYRTGDLARWLPDGVIEFLGRIDQQVKIRGYRIEPGEIENYLVRLDFIDEAVVIDRKNRDGEKYLCAYIAASKSPGGVDPGELKKILSNHFPDYMVPAYFVQLEEIPLTPNGKVDRRALPEPETGAGGGAYSAPRNRVEEKMAEIWALVLGVDKELIGIDADFFEMGGHSLKATIMISKIHKAFDVKVPLAELFRTPTIRELAEYINGLTVDKFTSIRAAEEKEYYELSSAQKRLYILQQMEVAVTTYNIPYVMVLEGELDRERFEDTSRKLIHRHESLRTSFEMINGQPFQKIHNHVDFMIKYDDSIRGGPGEQIKHFVRPFDLAQAPLLRVELIKETGTKHILMVDFHHIITDGTSMELFVKEFMALYAGEELAPLPLQYKDFAQWQNSREQREAIRQQEKYWLKQFEGEVPLLDLPADFARPPVQSFAGNTLSFELSTDETNGLNRLASKEGVTLYMVLLALYNIFLARITGQEDMVVGTPIAARRHADLERIIGMFVNTLALRNYPADEKIFTLFLREVKERTLAAFENQEYQFEDLVERLLINRDAGRNPLFDAAFSLENMEAQAGEIPEVEVPGLRLIPYDNETSTAKFDLTLTCVETGERLFCLFNYCTKLFREETVKRFAEYFKKVVRSVLDAPGARLSEIEIISRAEKKRVLYDFNDTETSYPRDKTIHRLFQEQVEQTPDHIALVGIRKTHMTYRELDEKSNRLAHLLVEKGVEPGVPDSIVGIMMERSLEMIIGIMGILKTGGAYVPLNPKAPASRSKFILEECRTGVLVSGVSKVSEVSEDIEVIDLNKIGPIGPIGPILHGLSTDLCYVIFTSGSTGKPKGVPITHANLCPLLHWGYRELGLGTKDRFLQNLSYYFDWSVWEIMMAITTGAVLYMVPDDLLLNPKACISFMNRYNITVLHITPTQYQYFVNVGRKLEFLKYLFIGAEKLSRELVERSFESVNEDCRVFNMYGPTECTIISAVLEIKRSDVKKFEILSSVPIGGPVANIDLLVLDKYLNPCPVNVSGELYIAGDCVARGYLNNPELTAERFVKVNRSYRSYRSYISYRTGDLVRWLPDGTIEFLGRIDYQVKIRGFRIESGEIESHLLTYELVKEVVVIDREKQDGEKYLCAYIVSEEDFDLLKLKEHLSKSLPDYMIPSHFMRLESIPLTPNGKLDRRALPMPGVQVGEAYTPPSDEMEEKLTMVWSEVLGIKKEKISVDANFFALGGHSLNATILIAKIHKAFDAKIPLTAVFLLPTIRGLARYIKDSVEEKHIAVPAAEEKEYYRLSSAQKRLYILQQMEPDSTVYNMPYAVWLDIAVDKEKIEKTFKQLIRRHESLRTSFLVVNEEPVQKIHKDVAWSMEQGAWDRDSLHAPCPMPHANFVRPFDLSQVPLLRVGLIQQEEEKYIFMMDMHHIISDGVSQGIFVKEFMALYNNSGVSLPPLKLQYKDYARWQNGDQQVESLMQQKQYWLERFAGELPVLNLPYDYPRPAVQSFEGTYKTFFMDKEQTAALRALAANEGVTLYMGMLAVFTLLLSRLSGQEDIIIGSPVAGRRHADLQLIMGMFVNTLAMRNYPVGEKTVSSFLKEVKQGCLEAFENQEYPFETLVEKVSAARDVGRNPVFDVMFALQNLEELEQETIDHIRPYEYESRIAKFDLTLAAAEHEDSIALSLEYCTRLFKEETIERFIDYFKNIVSSVVEDHHQKICHVEMLREEEKQHILLDFNDTGEPYPNHQTIPQLFESRVEQTPNHIALIGPVGQHLTYRELDEKSGRLAHLLLEKGLGPNARDSIVGIMMERSLEVIIGIMGILKAEGAYLPIETGYPEERITYMLKDSGAKVLLTNLPEGHHSFNCQLSIVNYQLSMIGEAQPATRNPQPATSLAYVIYTSGTTGRPKGVMVEHKSLVNLCSWHHHSFALTENDKATQYASLSFDASVWEIFPYLVKGSALHILDEEIRLDIPALKEYFREHGITVSFLPTQLCEQFVEEESEVPALRVLLTGGDKLNRYTVRSYEFYNNYGPTENTVVTTSCRVWDDSGIIPIGKPIANNRVYILNKESTRLQPPGVPGELCISGDSLARGYLNNPELTNFKFQALAGHPLRIPDSFLSFSASQLLSFSLYRTGDLARWLPDPAARGAYIIEFLGRMDDQVKIRGYRIELGEIESLLLKHAAVREAVVLVLEDDSGEKHLCAYITAWSIEQGARREGTEVSTATELEEYLSQFLPDYMIPSHFMRLESIPLTTSGKVDRKALPRPGVQVGSQYIAPSNQIEEQLTLLWSEVLYIEKDKISVDANFFQLGGHSLKATILAVKMHKTFAVKTPLLQVFKNPTIRRLADFIKTAAADTFASIPSAEKKEYYELSSAQKRLYVLQQVEPDSTAYNVPIVVKLEPGFETGKLEQIFQQLSRRHDGFRTSFVLVDGEPVQKIHQDVEFEVKVLSLQTDETQIINDFVKPFHLSRAPLLRVQLVELGNKERLLMIDMHHILTDGTSSIVLIQEFAALYRGLTLEPLRIQYKDYSEWQMSSGTRVLIEVQRAYWLEEFSGDIPCLDLPLDFERPEVLNFEGKQISFEIEAQALKGLKEIAVSTDATLFMVLLAIFNIFLSRICGQEEVIVGTPIAGRRHHDLQYIVGMFVNTLVLKNRCLQEETFADYLAEIRDRTAKAFENQDYQFEDLVSDLLVEREPGRHPLFDVMLVLQNMEIQPGTIPEVELSELQLKEVDVGRENTLFDLLFMAYETGENLAFFVNYNTRLFRQETIERFFHYFKEVLIQVMENKTILLKDIAISHELVETKKKGLLEEEGDFAF